MLEIEGSDMKEQMTYKEAMDYLASVNQYGSVLGLENIKELLNGLGNPQDRLSFVHIAGTNGKGSVGAFIASILTKAGYYVGRYISPVVLEYRESIQTMRNNGTPVYIKEENIARHLSQIKKVIENMLKKGKTHPTPFEIETAMAFLEFAEQKCDLVVLEVGLGGRLDSTNIIKTTKCAVLTSISMDHIGILGDTLDKIAYEKAGIIKENIPVVSAIQEEMVEHAIREQAKEKNASLTFVKEASISKIKYTLDKTTFFYQNDEMGVRENIETTLLGEYQPYNISTAIETVLCLKKNGFQISWDNIKEGIKATVWHGRFEIVHKSPIVIIDGAHNENAAISLRKSMDFYFKGKRIFAVLGIFADKEYEKILETTLDCIEKVFAIKPKNHRSLCSKELASVASKYCNKTEDARTTENAIKLALNEAKEEDIILVYGSLSYLHEVVEYFQ